MTTVVYGRSGSGKTSYILEKIASLAEAGADSVLIVPEQYAYTAERELAGYCGTSITLHAEVLTFRGLAKRVFKETGGSPVAIEESGKYLAMYRAYNDVSNALRVYRGRRIHELCKKLVSCIDEFKRYRISPEDITFEEDSCGGLYDKLHDLSILYSAYEAIVGKITGGETDELSELYLRLSESKWFGGKHIFFDGFSSYSLAELAVVQNAAEDSDEVTVTLLTDSCDDSGEPVFDYARETLADIRRVCGEVLCVSSGSSQSERFGDKNNGVSILERELFSRSGKAIDYSGKDEVRLVSASSARVECEIAAADIRRLVIEKKMRWRDISVLVPPECAPLAAAVFTKYNIPYFSDMRFPILSAVPVRTVVSAVEAAVHLRSDDFLRLAKTGLAGVSREQADLLENYVSIWGIKGEKWFYPFVGNPDSFGEAFTDESRQTLSALNEMREKLTNPIRRLREGLKMGHGAEMADAVGRYLQEIEFKKGIDLLCNHLSGSKELRTAEEYRQLFEFIQRGLEQFAMVMDGIALSPEEFSSMFKLVMSAETVGTIPTTLDGVQLGTAARARFPSPKAVFVLGVTEGVFPAVPADTGILTSVDRKRLFDDRGIELNYDMEKTMRGSLLNAYRVLSAPSEYLYLSAPRSSSSGGKLSRSWIFHAIENVLNIKTEIIDETKAEFRTWAPVPCAELGVSAIFGEGTDSVSVSAYAASSDTAVGKDFLSKAGQANSNIRGPLSQQMSQELYGKDPTITVSRIEAYNHCAFQAFVRYGLKLKDRSKAEFNPLSIGNLVHGVIEKTCSEIASRRGDPWSTITDEEACALVKKKAEAYASEYYGGMDNLTARMKWIFERTELNLCKIICELINEFRNSDFRPAAFEYDIGFKRIEVDGKSVNITGKIDRLDTWVHNGETYVRVCDYKTGSKIFDYGEIKAGLNIQLLLYLTIFDRDHKTLPAGVLYIPLLTSVKNENSKNETTNRTGVLLNDSRVIEAMEHPVEGKTVHYIPVKYKNGVPGGGALISNEEFGFLSDEVDRVVKEYVSGIENGNIECNPHTISKASGSYCDFCSLRRICQFDTGRRGDVFRTIPEIKRDEYFAEKYAEIGTKDGGENNGLDS